MPGSSQIITMTKLYYVLVFFSFNFYCHAQYTGGDGDGFSFDLINTDPQHYHGNYNDGFAMGLFLDIGNTLYHGNIADGFATLDHDGSNTMYQGDSLDGFALGNLYQTYIWTGTNGSGWLVNDNWNHNQPPGIRHSVIIPAGVPHWPAVNAGIFAIGKNPNEGAYTCGQLLVKNNAQITTRINCFVENYGRLIIRGSFYAKNQSPNAFHNFSGSSLTLHTHALLSIGE